MIKYILLCLCCCLCVPVLAKKKKSSKREEMIVIEKSGQNALKSLLSSLEPNSITQHLAFYELYPDTKEGKQALSRAWQLLNRGNVADAKEMALPPFDIQAIISLVTRQAHDAPVKLNEEQLAVIEKIAQPLCNRRLKGFGIWTKDELLRLPPGEVDLGRGLLLNQFDTSEDLKNDVRQYEASLDLMSLQILAHLPPKATHEEKIKEINRFIFQEMQFRFPPHSIHIKNIDLYTFLPSVLDGRQGVCLGVSILYLCLAQRLDLPLEIITPPGHIYVRYRNGDRIINIETTARGINVPSDAYLGINTRDLQQRNLKEVIGLAFVNQASVAWGQGEHEMTVTLYEKAAPYLPGDRLLNMFLGFNYLFTGRKAEGITLLKTLKGYTFDYAVSPENMPDDFLNGKVDAEGIKAIFLPVDETRDSVVEKQQALEKILKQYPHFRAGIMQLAITWLQLGRGSEALEVLERHHKIDPDNATVEYYLSILCMERLDYNAAWDYLKKTEKIVQEREHKPKALRSVRESLKRACPEPHAT